MGVCKIIVGEFSQGSFLLEVAVVHMWCARGSATLAAGILFGRDHWFRLVSKDENGQHRTTPPEIGVNTSSGGLSRERC
jgi:hypothetical protein